MSESLKALKKRQRNLQYKLKVVDQFIGHYEEVRDQCQIEVRLNMLEDVYQEYFTIREKIELLEEEAYEGSQADAEPEVKKEAEQHREENFAVLQEFEDHFCELKAELFKLRSQE